MQSTVECAIGQCFLEQEKKRRQRHEQLNIQWQDFDFHAKVTYAIKPQPEWWDEMTGFHSFTSWWKCTCGWRCPQASCCFPSQQPCRLDSQSLRPNSNSRTLLRARHSGIALLLLGVHAVWGEVEGVREGGRHTPLVRPQINKCWLVRMPRTRPLLPSAGAKPLK